MIFPLWTDREEGLKVPGSHPPAHWHVHSSILPNPICFHGNYCGNKEMRMWEEEVGGRKMEWGQWKKTFIERGYVNN